MEASHATELKCVGQEKGYNLKKITPLVHCYLILSTVGSNPRRPSLQIFSPNKTYCFVSNGS